MLSGDFFLIVDISEFTFILRLRVKKTPIEI